MSDLSETRYEHEGTYSPTSEEIGQAIDWETEIARRYYHARGSKTAGQHFNTLITARIKLLSLHQDRMIRQDDKARAANTIMYWLSRRHDPLLAWDTYLSR